MRIAVLDDYPDAFRTLPAFERLRGHDVVVHTEPVRDAGVLVERLRDADVALLTQQRSRLTRDVVERLPRLRLVSQTGRATSHLDLEALTERGVLVSLGGGGMTAPTAELTWGLILAALRHIPDEVARLKAGGWQRSLGTSLEGKTLGVYAYGRIGSAVARVGRAFGTRVVCFGREASTSRARADGFAVAESREAFFAECDVLSLHLPLNEATRGIVTADDLARMRRTALLVNTSRAPIVAEGALVAALRAGRPGFAAVDVYEDEPVLDADHPLLRLPNALCTPHLGYVTREAYEVIYERAVEGILAFAAGAPINVVNPEALGRR